MAAARIVMNDWGEKWGKMLDTMNIILGMLTGYVDDVRTKINISKNGDKMEP